MKKKDRTIQRTNTITSADLTRYRGTVKIIHEAWDNLPEDIEMHEREMFIELTSKVLTLQNQLREKDKDTDDLN
ncbi:MAG: hypothetical protein ACM3IJ_03705 [Candidatus Levyibacteriota bacterium]